MNITDLEDLIKNGESQTLEFKSSTAKLKNAFETLCAFLNGEDGIVLIGVADNGKIIGQHVADKTRLEIANMLKKLEPAANIAIDYISIEKDKQVIILKANPDQRCIPYSFNSRAYERKESETHFMAQGRYQQLLLSRDLDPHSWESQFAVGISIDDLDIAEINQTFQDIRNNKRVDAIIKNDNIVDNLTRLKLMENGHLLNAAVVLFAKDISRHYMQCVLRMARFKGTEKGGFIDSRHVFGNAFQLLREAELFIDRNTAVASNLKTGKLTRDDQPEYPFDAVREALINAFVHRNYSSVGGSTTITIYDDRMEIANLGMLSPNITLDDLKKVHTSYPRNPQIINVFYRRGLIESMGIGTQEIVKACLAVNMREPEFFEQAGNFVTRLWSRHFQTQVDDIDLTQRQKKILKLLRQSPTSPKDIFVLLKEDITDRTLRNDLIALKQKGYIDSKGKTKQTKWFAVKITEIRK
ncbi:MAG: putative DNA binding domain-containing protein [Gammaproteobacteria bacterium]|nr:putative DNA binding domain-containing protein [Gammaproteobacteria bacterium]